MLGSRRADLLGRVRRRLQAGGFWSHLFGLLLRRHVQQAGIILVKGGWPLPTIDNDGGRIEIGNCALWSGVRLEVWKGAHLAIGTGTYLNRNTEVVAAHAVTIGRDCKIARDVLIMDTDQHPLPGANLVAAPVVIEDRVWIGARAIILKGVQIGHDSVIGAGAIVTKSVPAGSVVVGTAARVIRSLASSE
jgi:acetyltransferase-like isoleucine patch superfamily enzyme